MKNLTHRQATRFIDLRLDGMLNENQQSLLDEHLRICASCRHYSHEMESLPSQLSHEFRTRWDKNPGPSQNAIRNVTITARKIPMTNRFSSSFRFLAGAIALIVMAFAINFVVSRLQSTANASNNAAPTPGSAVNLTIDPQSCKSSTLDSVPGDLYGHDIVQNTSLIDGDFSYKFWLYCDPALKPDDQEHFSAISGLGVYASWRYNGPQVEGKTQYYFEFEPNDPLGTSGSNGPFYKASAGAKLGIHLAPAAVQTHVQQGKPIEFRIVIDSPLGRDGATLSIYFEPTHAGLRVTKLQVNSIHPVSEDLLAFSSTESGNSEIYTMRPDGNELTNLTNNPANDSNPLWSPDGQHIAFESDRNGSYQIYWMDADGSNVNQLTHNKSDHRLNINLDNKMNPWSPDGTKILFLQNSSDNNWGLYTIGIAGRDQTLLASAKSYFMNVSWSSDGKHVAYVLDDSPSPNGEFWPNIYVVDSDGKNTRALKTLIPQSEKLDLPYYWSPDNETIMFVANQEDQEHQSLYEFNLLTGALVQTETLKSRLVDWQEDMALILDIHESVPSFIWQKSDGTSNTQEWDFRNCLFDFTKSSHGNLAIGGFCNDTNKFQLYWANADGSASQQLYASTPFNYTRELGEITWSPDDRYVTFMLSSDMPISEFQTRFYILNVQDALKDPLTPPKEITIGDDQIHAIPAWQPRP